MERIALVEELGQRSEAEGQLEVAAVGDADVAGLVEAPEDSERDSVVRWAGKLDEGADDADGVGDVRLHHARHPDEFAAELEHLGCVDAVALGSGLELVEVLASAIDPNGLEISRAPWDL